MGVYSSYTGTCIYQYISHMEATISLFLLYRFELLYCLSQILRSPNELILILEYVNGSTTEGEATLIYIVDAVRLV